MSGVTDFMRYPADQRERMIVRQVDECGPILRNVFLRGIHLEDPATGKEMTVEDRRELWPSVYLCLYECCYRALEAQRFRILSNSWPLLTSAAFLLSLHSIIGYDFVPLYAPLRVGLPLQPREPNGSMRSVMVDYMTVVLSNAFEGAFMPEDVEPAMYSVFALTGWKGCERMERQGVREPELAALVAEGERYRVEHAANRRAAMGRDAARGEWTALRRIDMDGSGRGGNGGRGGLSRKKTRRGRRSLSKSLSARRAGRSLGALRASGKSLSPIRVLRPARRGSTRKQRASHR